MRAAELFEQRLPSSEVARAVGVHPESVRRWKRLWEQGGVQALRRRPATGVGRPSWTTPSSKRFGLRWSRAPRRMGSRRTCGRWNGSAWWLSG
ncbi:helix-turn-helix domain-containing protein [Streptomyces sp. NPDC085932]|uniref:helix-turn-helix domain-containing protein n=1 Tax=Streptomyces sp. NPDC085932 TaxID=3365741 RepID=UPI0037D85A5C